MNISVVLLPCPNRNRLHQGNGPGTPTEMRQLENDRFIATDFADVRMWANLNSSAINGKGGPYFYYLNIGPPSGPWTYWEMPHGDMLLEDRLWIPIEMYEAFYVEVA
jgi:hypothetical protein